MSISFSAARSLLRPTLIGTTIAFSMSLAYAEAPSPQAQLQEFFSHAAHPLKEDADLKPLYEAIGERRFVLLGEASHGTREYYTKRAQISRDLIKNKGFRFVAVEGDWPSLAPLNDYIKGRSADDASAASIMREYVTRWPEWMWANEEFADFVEWLRNYNDDRPEKEMVGLYGLDMQDPGRSMEHVLNWFEEYDADYHQEAAQIYQRILDFPEGFRGYAQYLIRGGERLDSQLQEIIDRLRAHQGEQSAAELDKELWASLENAKAVSRAEAQYHGAANQSSDSWNARARHMHEALLRYAERHGQNSRGIVWAHNTHVGDSSATSMQHQGQVNIGHLARESEGEDEVFLLGFGTHKGEVVAGGSWGADRERMTVPPARADSYEALMHNAELDRALLLFDEQARTGDLATPMYQRAIGVVYTPPQEAYVPTILTRRYDALIYIDETRALTPL